MEPTKKTSPWVWVGVVVVVIIIAIGAVWYFSNGNKGSSAGTGQVSQGQVVAGFPQWLFVDAPVSTQASSTPSGVANSYAVNSTSTNQYTTEWNSSTSMEGLYTDFTSVLMARGYAITNRTDADAFKTIYAVEASSTVNIVITPQDTGSSVSITYVTQ